MVHDFIAGYHDLLCTREEEKKAFRTILVQPSFVYSFLHQLAIPRVRLPPDKSDKSLTHEFLTSECSA